MKLKSGIQNGGGVMVWEIFSWHTFGPLAEYIKCLDMTFVDIYIYIIFFSSENWGKNESSHWTFFVISFLFGVKRGQDISMEIPGCRLFSKSGLISQMI